MTRTELAVSALVVVAWFGASAVAYALIARALIRWGRR